jgi:hypothetical protein
MISICSSFGRATKSWSKAALGGSVSQAGRASISQGFATYVLRALVECTDEGRCSWSSVWGAVAAAELLL